MFLANDPYIVDVASGSVGVSVVAGPKTHVRPAVTCRSVTCKAEFSV